MQKKVVLGIVLGLIVIASISSFALAAESGSGKSFNLFGKLKQGAYGIVSSFLGLFEKNIQLSPISYSCRVFSPSARYYGDALLTSGVNNDNLVDEQKAHCLTGGYVAFSCFDTEVASSTRECDGYREGSCFIVSKDTICEEGKECREGVLGGEGSARVACVSSLCGNGDVDEGEQCDGENLGGNTCESLGYTGGTLRCLDFALGGVNFACQFITNDCTTTDCGNGEVDSDETCETCPEDVDSNPDECACGSQTLCGNDCTSCETGICQDGTCQTDPCEGVVCGDCETCSDGVCNPMNCDDGNACTTNDRCEYGGCFYDETSIDDGNACTDDFCDSGTGEVSHVSSICDDGDACTDDSCDSTIGCVYKPNSNSGCDAKCSDPEGSPGESRDCSSLSGLGYSCGSSECVQFEGEDPYWNVAACYASGDTEDCYVLGLGETGQATCQSDGNWDASGCNNQCKGDSPKTKDVSKTYWVNILDLINLPAIIKQNFADFEKTVMGPALNSLSKEGKCEPANTGSQIKCVEYNADTRAANVNADPQKVANKNTCPSKGETKTEEGYIEGNSKVNCFADMQRNAVAILAELIAKEQRKGCSGRASMRFKNYVPDSGDGKCSATYVATLTYDDDAVRSKLVGANVVVSANLQKTFDCKEV
jgi:hypothetical protein